MNNTYFGIMDKEGNVKYCDGTPIFDTKYRNKNPEYDIYGPSTRLYPFGQRIKFIPENDENGKEPIKF